MALTTTTVASAVSATPSGQLSAVIVTAFTNPSAGGIGPQVIGRFATGEYVLITANTGTSLQVVRGYNGSRVAAHPLYEGFQYGLANDAAWPAANADTLQIAPVTITNAETVTLTGTTGTDAATVTTPWPAFLACTGASGAGVNLPYPQVGAMYTVKNTSTGTMKIYSVGASINGTTGTTAVNLTSTGVDGSIFWCAVAGAWQGAPNSV